MNYEFIFWRNSSHSTKFLKYKKKVLIIVMLMLFTCVLMCFVFIFLQLLVVRIWLVPLFGTIAMSSYAFLVTQWFVPVCIKHHPCTWLGISLFDSRHLYNYIILHNGLVYKSQQDAHVTEFIFVWELLYMFQVSLAPIFRSTKQL